MRTFTAGPAMATTSSCIGLRGIRSRRANPPMGSRVMSGVRMPYRRAASTCPNSCNSTQKNTKPMNKAPMAPCVSARNSNNSRKVTWMRTSVPSTRPMENDHFMMR